MCFQRLEEKHVKAGEFWKVSFHRSHRGMDLGQKPHSGRSCLELQNLIARGDIEFLLNLSVRVLVKPDQKAHLCEVLVIPRLMGGAGFLPTPQRKRSLSLWSFMSLMRLETPKTCLVVAGRISGRGLLQGLVPRAVESSAEVCPPHLQFGLAEFHTELRPFPWFTGFAFVQRTCPLVVLCLFHPPYVNA